ncbi:unnamed protein product [Aureobasidium uvarum]|uniref:Uncharacterized protein n=1 Tax=Aureobasidium uvarum TaxID=2773716 RepID=A0A9N8PQG1_9PEZI|nr:unnamed protein product [Aureobasidium uvarum]
MRFAAVATLAFVGAVAAQNSTTAATGCVAKDNACRTTRMPDGSSANQAQCSANNAQCQGDCYSAYNTCRTTPVDGLSANQAQCVSEYATCLGENPVAASGGLISSFIPYSATATVSASSTASASASASAANCVAKDNACRASDPVTGLSANQAQCSAENAQCQGDCYAALGKCQTTRMPDGSSANQAQCVSEYATCLGENPVASTGGIISSFIPYTATASASASSMVYMTEVVTCVSILLYVPTFLMGIMLISQNRLTTVCPAPTAGAYVTTIHSNVYTVSSATTITVTNCPCTVSSKVPAASVTGGAQGGMMTSAGNGNKNGTATATQSKPAVYTGAAANVAAGMGFLGAAAGAVMLL